MPGHRIAIAIDPCFIPKARKKTPGVDWFWSGCAGAIKHGLEILVLSIVDADAKDAVFLKAEQTFTSKCCGRKPKCTKGMEDPASPLPTSNYNYERRNQTTAHVYSMLTMALFEAIDEIECPIFIESSSSVTLEEGIKKCTLSPWIYEEVGYMGKLPHKIPSRFSRTQYFSVGAESVILNEAAIRDSLQMAHPLDFSNFKLIDKSDLTDMKGYNGESSLNTLYKRKLLLKKAHLLLVKAHQVS